MRLASLCALSSGLEEKKRKKMGMQWRGDEEEGGKNAGQTEGASEFVDGKKEIEE